MPPGRQCWFSDSRPALAGSRLIAAPLLLSCSFSDEDWSLRKQKKGKKNKGQQVGCRAAPAAELSMDTLQCRRCLVALCCPQACLPCRWSASAGGAGDCCEACEFACAANPVHPTPLRREAVSRTTGAAAAARVRSRGRSKTSRRSSKRRASKSSSSSRKRSGSSRRAAAAAARARRRATADASNANHFCCELASIRRSSAQRFCTLVYHPF